MGTSNHSKSKIRWIVALIAAQMFVFNVYGQEDHISTKLNEKEDEEEEKERPISYGWKSRDFVYGQNIIHRPTLDQQLNSFSNYHFFSPLHFLGVSATRVLRVNRRYTLFNSISYSQIWPQKIQLNNTISGWITGGNFYLTILGYDLFYNTPKLDLMIDFGFNTGRLRLFGDPLIKQKNPYFSPSITIAPRYFLGDMSIQMRFTADYDVSSLNWRRMTFSQSDKITLGPTSSTGIRISLALGYKLPY